jgi:hypothetical protein
LKGTSKRFQNAFRDVGAGFKASFPKARPTFLFGMPGWCVDWDWDPPRQLMRGTMDPKKFAILMAEGKSGITLHFWCLPRYGLLQQEKVALEAAGFKVMVGCLRFTKKTDYPVAAIRRFIDATAP